MTLPLYCHDTPAPTAMAWATSKGGPPVAPRHRQLPEREMKEGNLRAACWLKGRGRSCLVLAHTARSLAQGRREAYCDKGALPPRQRRAPGFEGWPMVEKTLRGMGL